MDTIHSRNGRRAIALLAIVLKALAVWLFLAWPREQHMPSAASADFAASPAVLARGAVLARAGDCMACHTVRGGAPYAGGRLLATPFGAIATPNITPDRASGIGAWSADDFWRALHNGKSRDGRLLYPAFPYPNYTKVTRADADALYAYLHALPAVRQPNAPHQLRFPYNTQAALAGWRLLYFTPAVFAPTPTRSPEWNRGAYLVEGLGHCSACHSARNSAGASDDALGGALLPGGAWYAPSLTAAGEAGQQQIAVAEIGALLHGGISSSASVAGPMAEVVEASLQHLADADITAMAVYLQALPATPRVPAQTLAPTPQLLQLKQQGRQLYDKHCVACHGADGEGMPPHYPALAGNRALTMESAVNPIRLVLHGGFAPATGGNPRPYGMPPYGHLLNDAEVAALLSYLRASWGNQAAPVSARSVNALRGAALD
ncbi:cytochrome c [Massilia sp. PWRC2]|uniref:cytochrome c n=1 Tax=Massilia sp. PWRC2 TaxID=2804626 RepID=UPI003CE8D719